MQLNEFLITNRKTLLLVGIGLLLTEVWMDLTTELGIENLKPIILTAIMLGMSYLIIMRGKVKPVKQEEENLLPPLPQYPQSYQQETPPQRPLIQQPMYIPPEEHNEKMQKLKSIFRKV